MLAANDPEWINISHAAAFWCSTFQFRGCLGDYTVNGYWDLIKFLQTQWGQYRKTEKHFLRQYQVYVKYFCFCKNKQQKETWMIIISLLLKELSDFKL